MQSSYGESKSTCFLCRKRVRDVRGEEAKVMRTMATYQAFFGLTLFVGPVMVSIASFAAYTGAHISLSLSSLTHHHSFAYSRKNIGKASFELIT